MKWIAVSDALPPMVDTPLLISDTVLCQNCIGQTFLAYVRYDQLEEFDPVWTQRGRDMYSMDDIVRWIPLCDILAKIS